MKLGSDYGHFRHDRADKNDNLHIVTQKKYFPAYAKQQGVVEGERMKTASGMYRDQHTGVAYRGKTGQDGNDSYMTPDYLIQKYQERLAQIASGPYKRPKEVAQLKSRIAKLQGKQGVAEGEWDGTGGQDVAAAIASNGIDSQDAETEKQISLSEEMIADRLKNELALFKSGTKSKDKGISKKPADRDVQSKKPANASKIDKK
jgi:hypothetical protein